MPGLIDQWGNPINAVSLTKEVAGPVVVGQRPAVITTPFIGLDPALLGSSMAAADQGDSLAWQEIAEQIEARDLHYLGVLNTRKRTIAQLPITVEPASEDPEHEKHADFVRDWLRKGLVRKIAYDILDAIGKGWSVHELTWKLSPGDNRIVDAKFRPQRWFDISWQDGETVMVRSENVAPAAPVIADAPVQAGFSLLPERKFVIHRHPSWSGLTIGGGLTRACAWAVMFKAFASRDWGLFVQSYGLPIRVGKWGPGSSEDDRAKLRQAVFSLAGGAAAIIPESMQIEFPEPRSASARHDLHIMRTDWCDSQISKAVLGQTGTTDSKQGAHASGQIHRQVQEDIERADAMLLEQTINDQMVAPMIAFTFGAQPDGYPKLSIGRPDEAPNSELIQAIQWAGPQGWTVPAQALYDRFNIKPPEPDEKDLIGGRAPPPPVEPATDLPARLQPPVDRPSEAPGATVKDEPKPGGRTADGENDAAPRGPSGAPNRSRHMLSAGASMQFGRILSRHVAQNGPRIVDALTERNASDAAAALAKMTTAVRTQVEAADSMEDLHARLERLGLPDEDFADAMALAMTVAELAGEATVLDQVRAATGAHA